MRYYLGLNSENNFNDPIFSSFDGIGMIRGENLCINKTSYFLDPLFCEYVTKYLCEIADKFEGKPVTYRTADLTSKQINLLDFADEIIVNEKDVLVGNRGIRRNLTHLPAYYEELKCFVNAYKKHKNLQILIPFVSTVEEFLKAREILTSLGYNGKIGIMIETAATMLLLDEFEKASCDFYVIGVNDLTGSLLYSNRDTNVYTINNRAVYKSIELLSQQLRKYNKPVVIAGYLNKEFETFCKDKIDFLNVHYNEIPDIFSVQNAQFFKNPYKEMRVEYERRKNSSK